MKIKQKELKILCCKIYEKFGDKKITSNDVFNVIDLPQRRVGIILRQIWFSGYAVKHKERLNGTVQYSMKKPSPT